MGHLSIGGATGCLARVNVSIRLAPWTPGPPGDGHRHARSADARLSEVRPVDVESRCVHRSRPCALQNIGHQRLSHRGRNRGPNAYVQNLEFFAAWNSFLANQDQSFLRIDSAADLERVKAWPHRRAARRPERGALSHPGRRGYVLRHRPASGAAHLQRQEPDRQRLHGTTRRRHLRLRCGDRRAQ